MSSSPRHSQPASEDYLWVDGKIFERERERRAAEAGGKECRIGRQVRWPGEPVLFGDTHIHTRNTWARIALFKVERGGGEKGQSRA